jgi:cation diffusion facilitator CzcD-associated flavoprotein CzcO
MDSSASAHHRMAIVGAGFAGLGMAIKLKQDGVEDFVVLERAEDLGGTWRDNTYPGCGCDVPSHLYSFSFAPNPGWTRTFSRQPEIWEYMRGVSRRYGVDPHIRYNHEVTSARWDAEHELWRIETSAGALSADVLLAAPGPLSEPKLPPIPGIDSFKGEMFHSARWNHAHSLRGERVGVIGTGASAIQFVPEIQPLVGELHLFQRTPPWIVPSRDRAVSRAERSIFRALPPAQLAMRAMIYWAQELLVLGFMHPRPGSPVERMARRHLETQVADPQLRGKLTPNYRAGCKRLLISDDYYPSLQQPNVELITDSIREVTPTGVLTADGTMHELDTIIFGTGFHVTDMPVGRWVRGSDGRSLADAWKGSPQAYLGASVTGFPNLFLLVGPNTGLGHTSLVFMIESQLNHVMGCLRFMRRHGLHTFEVREAVQRRFNERIQQRLQGTVWNSGGCTSWYIDENGKNTTIWPGFTWPFRRLTRHFRPADYRLLPQHHPIDPLRASPVRPAAAPIAAPSAGSEFSYDRHPHAAEHA